MFESSADALVNAVNTVGVMGAGIALEFKKRYPKNFSEYKTACDKKEFKTGSILMVNENDGKTIINFPTKKHWVNDSNYEYIKSGLRALKKELEKGSIKSIALPPLGCELKGLKWPKVKKLIKRELGSLEIIINVYEPQ